MDNHKTIDNDIPKFLNNNIEILLDVNSTATELSVSTATVRNWVKLGKLSTVQTRGRGLHFYKSEVDRLYKEIINGKNDKLKGRRNKKAVKGNDLYVDYIIDSGINTSIGKEVLSNEPSFFTEENIRGLLAFFAYNLYKQTDYTNDKKGFKSLVQQLSDYNIDDLLSRYSSFTVPDYVPYQDFLGYIYISVSKLTERKSSGSYFTPTKVVERMMTLVDFNEKTVIDPCCGSGNFLLTALKSGVSAEKLYGNDLDDIAVILTKINLYLNGVQDIDLLNSHITNCDFLFEKMGKYDIIIGNPPWGYEYSKDEIKCLLNAYKTASIHGTESYDLFVEHSFEVLKDDGVIAFVLPEAILNVKSHRKVREVISKLASVEFVSYIGNAFGGVTCPCILLGLRKNHKGETCGCYVENGHKTFTIRQNRDLSDEYWNLKLSDDEASCLSKIVNTEHAITLKGKADFALGIVTGANKEYISTKKTDDNEVVLKGSNILKYSIQPSANYISFEPENFQQVAPTEMYRAKEKLIYRFICATPVFAYDDKQTLSLNSANILIPHVDGISMKYIMAVLNSRTVSFWCRKRYNSVKLLRSHIEDIPIPVPTKDEQDRIIQMTDSLINMDNIDRDNKLNKYNAIEDELMNLYNLDQYERNMINEDSRKYDTFL